MPFHKSSTCKALLHPFKALFDFFDRSPISISSSFRTDNIVSWEEMPKKNAGRGRNVQKNDALPNMTASATPRKSKRNNVQQ
jgi:hypothetical protein